MRPSRRRQIDLHATLKAGAVGALGLACPQVSDWHATPLKLLTRGLDDLLSSSARAEQVFRPGR